MDLALERTISLDTPKEMNAATNEKYWEQLTLKYRERLYYVIISMVRSHADADDILQETFLKAFQHIDKFRGESSIYTWLCRIAINHSISFLRKNKVKRMLSFENMHQEPVSNMIKPDEGLEKAELRQIIREAVERLPEKQKAVFILRYFDELPYAQIAKIAQKSEGALKANFFHAVRKISKYMESLGYFDTHFVGASDEQEG